MPKEDSIYEYIVNSINNIITNGISYYADKDSDKLNRLLDIYDYINDDAVAIIDIESNNIEENNVDEAVEELPVIETIEPKVEKKINDDSTIVQEVSDIMDDFLSKMSDIKIAVLNLENDLSLYYDNKLSNELINSNIMVDIESKEEPTEEKYEDKNDFITYQQQYDNGQRIVAKTIKSSDVASVNFVPLNKEYTIGPEKKKEEIVSINNMDDTNPIVKDDKKTNTELDSVISEEKIEDELFIEEKPKKHSILDLFRKRK